MDDLIADDLSSDLVLTLPPCPPANTGVHSWIYRVCKLALGHGVKESEIHCFIQANATRPLQPNEVEDAVDASKRDLAMEADGTKKPYPQWAAKNHEVIKGIPSHQPPEPVEISAKEALEALFPGNPLVCLAKELWYCATRPLCDFKGPENWSFVVPSPMIALKGKTKKGTESPRGLDNVGLRKYLVIECDFSADDVAATGFATTQEMCFSVLMQLAEYRPLLCVVDSGGKSLHGWFPVDPKEGEDGKKLRGFMDYAAILGGDTKTWTKNQLVRLPGGLRDNGKRQSVLLWNIEAIRRWA